MKNKQSVKLAAAAVVLVIAVGAYFGISHWNSLENAKESEDTSIKLASVSSSDITRFSYQYNGETITFVKEDDTWYNDADRNFPVKQTSIEGKLSSAASTTATRELEADDAALTEYGLDDPVNTIILADSEGNETTFEIGSQNESTSEYYCRLNHENKVYMISSSLGSMMSFDIYSVADMNSYPYIDSSQIKSISSDNGTDVTDFDPETDSAAYTAASALTYTTHVNYNCTDLSEYGLDKPQYTITIKYSEAEEESETQEHSESVEETEPPVDDADLQEIILYIGNAADSGYYVRVEGANQIHTMTTSALSELLK